MPTPEVFIASLLAARLAHRLPVGLIAAVGAVLAADTLLLTIPNQLGVDYNARLLQTIADHVAPHLR
ncbi:hypothetical protein [Streptomyces sp. NBC_01483]|uniref:hypothetical protein n=1 Tax=Streptomyces sp. NBC_01483 TaxID=2903883 RepID=UPI003FCDF631